MRIPSARRLAASALIIVTSATLTLGVSSEAWGSTSSWDKSTPQTSSWDKVAPSTSSWDKTTGRTSSWD